jgi:putative oxidoreductase
MPLLARLYNLLIVVGNYFQSLFLLVFRLYWGWQFFITGQGKFTGHAKVVEFFTSLNLPFPDMTAWFVSGVEMFGGIFLLLGLASRPLGVVLSINMLVAYLSVDDDRAKLLSIFKDPTPFLQADPFFFMLAALLVFAFGPGMISVDYLLGRFVFNKYKKSEND